MPKPDIRCQRIIPMDSALATATATHVFPLHFSSAQEIRGGAMIPTVIPISTITATATMILISTAITRSATAHRSSTEFRTCTATVVATRPHHATSGITSSSVTATARVPTAAATMIGATASAPARGNFKPGTATARYLAPETATTAGQVIAASTPAPVTKTAAAILALLGGANPHLAAA